MISKSQIEENIIYFSKKYHAGYWSYNELKSALGRFQHANEFGTKYQKDYGVLRHYFPKNWREETLKSIINQKLTK